MVLAASLLQLALGLGLVAAIASIVLIWERGRYGAIESQLRDDRNRPLTRAEIRDWLREQLGDEYDRTPTPSIVAMENTLYRRQPGHRPGTDLDWIVLNEPRPRSVSPLDAHHPHSGLGR